MAFSRGPSEKFLRFRALGLSAGVGALFALLSHTGAMMNLEAVTYDARCRLNPVPGEADPRVVIIALDDSSLESMDWLAWPWPRELWAYLADYLADQGAAALFFDITFETSSSYGALEDSLFGAAASRIPTVFIANLFLDSAGATIPQRAVIPLEQPPLEGLLYPSARLPVAPISAGAEIFASPLVEADRDGVVRRVPLFFRTPEGIVPSPGLALAWIATGRDSLRYRGGRLFLRDGSVPVESDGTFIPRFMGPRGTYTTLGVDSVFSMMESGSDGSVFRDAVVLVGYTAVDLFDLKPTPLSANYPGVEVHATVCDNLMSGAGISRPGAGTAAAATLLLALAVGVVMVAVPSVGGSIGAGLFLILGYAGGVYLLFTGGVWMDAAAPLSGGIVSLLAGAVEANFRANRQKRFLRSAFSQYLSPEVVAQVVKNPSILTLGGERRVMTAFFSDVGGFTSISEKLEPERLVALLNIYLTAMTDIILKWGGTVDKFEGDAIVAFWGAPLPMNDHALRACRAALECQCMHEELNLRLENEGFPPLKTRIGLSTGPMVVGNMGSEKRFDYTVMGDAVNLASRLEGVNKVYGTPILLPGTTMEQAPGIRFLELDTVMVVGQSRPVALYTPFEEELPDWSALYVKALEMYRAGRPAEAMELFASLDHPAALTLRTRCEDMVGKGVPPDWNGVWKLSSK
jgi:adenylate cyclase